MTTPDQLDAWEHDAGRVRPEPAGRITARVLIVVGDVAEVVSDYHHRDDPLRVPVPVLADALGLSWGLLAGTRFTAVLDGDQLADIRPA